MANGNSRIEPSMPLTDRWSSKLYSSENKIFILAMALQCQSAVRKKIGVYNGPTWRWHGMRHDGFWVYIRMCEVDRMR
jgi:hypothetical protein